MSQTGLPSRFPAFIITQSLGAFNDNFFKMLLQLYVLQALTLDQAKGAISIATFVFTVPFVLFGPWSGYLADKYAKTTVMRYVKFIEIIVMLIGVVAFYLAELNIMFLVLFLMATQSTFFSPAKYGYIPETCHPAAASKANGWLEMSTFLSIILGTAFVGILLTFHYDNALIVAYYAVLIAILGSISVLFINKIPAVGIDTKFPWNPVTGIFRDLKFLKKQKALFLAAMANSYFWGLGLIFQTNILIYTKGMFAVTETQSNTLLSLVHAYMGIGFACGSLLASRWSGNKVELGLVPLGGFGMAFCGIILYFTSTSYISTSIIIFLAGVSGGLFIVPLYAYLQYYSRAKEKGRVLATTGILNGLFLVLGSLLYHLFVVVLEISSPLIYLIMGIISIFAVIYIITVIPEYLVRFCFWLLTNTVYRIKIIGTEFVPFRGPALLIANHVSFIDAFLIGATIQRFVRFIMHYDYYKLPVANKLFKLMNTIPIYPEAGHESVAKSLDDARKQIEEGHVVCIFPEGKLTRDGNINEFRPGFETVMRDLNCPIIPIYMHNVWGSIFSWEGGRVFIKWPKKIPYPITIEYGEPLAPDTKATEAEIIIRRMSNKY